MSAEFYKSLVFRKILLICCGAGLLSVLFVLDIANGPANYGFFEILQSFFSRSTDKNLSVIVFDMRLPAAIAAVLAGASLGLSGAVMQTLLANPLASPYTLGVGSAAGFGAAVGIVFFAGNFLSIGFFAFFFAILSIVFIYRLSNRINLGSSGIILIGIILVFIYQSLQAFVIYVADEAEVSSIVFWTFGSLSKANYASLSIMLAVFAAAFFISLYNAWSFNAVLLGDEIAQSMGVCVHSFKIKMLILASVLTATCVCFVGTIGFVGLLGAHISRILIGAEQRFFLPFSALIGALLLSFSSILSKNLISGVIFPIGIITSFIGALFFLAIVLNKGRG